MFNIWLSTTFWMMNTCFHQKDEGIMVTIDLVLKCTSGLYMDITVEIV